MKQTIRLLRDYLTRLVGIGKPKQKTIVVLKLKRSLAKKGSSRGPPDNTSNTAFTPQTSTTIQGVKHEPLLTKTPEKEAVTERNLKAC